MNEQEAALRVEELTKALKKYREAYYQQDAPLISDYDYDMLEQELKELETQFPSLLQADSPTQTVGGRAENALPRWLTPRPCFPWRTLSITTIWPLSATGWSKPE